MIAFISLIRFYGEITPFDVALLYRDGTGRLAEDTVPIILPHQVAYALFRTDRFDEVLAGTVEHRREFWLRHRHSPWFLAHPGRAYAEAHPEHCIGVRLWGDDAVALKNASVYAVSFGSVFCTRLASLLSRYLVFAVAVHKYVNLEPLWRALSWSLSILVSDDCLMPSHDWLGAALTGDRAQKAGESICGSYRFLLCLFTGDLKFLVETFKFIHSYNSGDEFCWACYARKVPSVLSGFIFSADAPCFLTTRSHLLYMSETGNGLAVCTLPGFHLGIILWDLMHTVHLGVLPVLLGAAFVILLERNHFNGPDGGPWMHRYNVQLQRASDEFVKFCKDNRVSSSQPHFTLGRLSLSHAKSDPPYFKGKAANNELVARFLLSIFSHLAHSSHDEHIRLVATCLWGFVRALDIFKTSGLFLDDRQRRDLETARKAALLSHAHLARDAISNGTQLFRTIPKHHFCDHIFRAPNGWNFACSWCFADEDFIGRLVRINRRSVNPHQLMRRYLVRLHLTFHLRRSSAPQL